MGGNGRREKRGKEGDTDRVERKGENGQKKKGEAERRKIEGKKEKET